MPRMVLLVAVAFVSMPPLAMSPWISCFPSLEFTLKFFYCLYLLAVFIPGDRQELTRLNMFYPRCSLGWMVEWAMRVTASGAGHRSKEGGAPA